jgi:hypothetical protein
MEKSKIIAKIIKDDSQTNIFVGKYLSEIKEMKKSLGMSLKELREFDLMICPDSSYLSKEINRLYNILLDQIAFHDESGHRLNILNGVKFITETDGGSWMAVFFREKDLEVILRKFNI